jgi:hypothetical protein
MSPPAADSAADAMDRQDKSTFDGLASPRVVVDVGSSAATGLDERRADLEALNRAFPDGHHEIEELLMHMDRLFAQLNGD